MTDLLYLDDTLLVDVSGVITGLGRDERAGFVTLDRTIFYPQGGGQPADKGTIRVDGSEAEVSFAGYLEGAVRHYLPDDFMQGARTGEAAQLRVDRDNRLCNARLHTAGHLVSHVVETLEPRLAPIKGHHFPNGPYVEFTNEQGVDAAALLAAMNEKLGADLRAALPVTARLADFSEISRLRPLLAPFVPKDKPTRIVTIGPYTAVPCGGTHVAHTGELGTVRATKAKNQKGNVRISYEI